MNSLVKNEIIRLTDAFLNPTEKQYRKITEEQMQEAIVYVNSVDKSHYLYLSKLAESSYKIELDFQSGTIINNAFTEQLKQKLNCNISVGLIDFIYSILEEYLYFHHYNDNASYDVALTMLN